MNTPQTNTLVDDNKTESIMLGAGCFWGVEEYFKQMPGITQTKVGYSGGHTENPSYKDVCTGTSGHAEVIYIEYNPEIVSLDTILEHFWQMHDPTQLNQQGLDHGTQYRSAIFYYSEEQKIASQKSKLNAAKFFKMPIVTVIEAAKFFWSAEEYHQRYFEKTGGQSCHVRFPTSDRF